jgi:predicted O-methyltransferase YrrM
MDLNLVLKYLNYKITSFTEHDIHSPFLYNFYMELVKNDYPYEDFEQLAKIRSALKANSTEINITDFGAGSKKINSNTRLISTIAKHGIAQKKQAEFLYRLLNKFQPKTIIELGTSIGLTSLYLSKAVKNSTIYTIEGCPNLYEFSKNLFKANGSKNITSLRGNFNTELPKLISNLNTIDFVYIDGNHAYQPTIDYFKLVLEKVNPNTIIVFDDINWSNDMQKAWDTIKNNKQVTLSLDFFHFGIVFFRKENLTKEHFTLNF